MSVSSIAQFRDLVGQIQQASDPQIKLALVRLAAETKEKLADSSPHSAVFFDSLRSSLSLLKGHANAEVRIGCLYDCANYFYLAGDVNKGITAAREGLALAIAVKNERLARKGQTFLGTLLADAGSLAESIECHVAAIDLARRLDDVDSRAVTTLNLGVALFYASQYQDAMACFDLAFGLIQDASLARSVRPGSLTNKALCCLHTGHISEGLLYAKRSIAESGSPTSAGETLARIIRECNYVHLLLEAKQIDLAATQLQKIRDLAHRAKSPKTIVMSEIVEGLLELHRGDAARGIQLLRDAKTHAGNTASLVQDALVGLVRGYELLGQHKNALESLQQLMQRVGSARQECALLQLRAVIGMPPTLGCDSERDLTAFHHREALLRAKVAEDQLAWSQIEMLERLAVTADLREEATGEHGYRVGRLSALLAEDLGMDSETCLAVDLAARLHDIGKMAVPDRILLTTLELKDAERHFMCQHTMFGSELLAKSNIPQLRLAEEIALHHHEWWDGSGYPKKLAGKRIPIHARIVALADVFDALTHGRPYAEPWSMDRAIEEIRQRRGTQFDPEMTDRFVALVARLRAKHKDLDEFLARAGRNSPFLQARRKIKVMLEQEREEERKHALPGNETRH